MANHYRLIIPELRGHGDSNVSTSINITSFVSDILTLLEQLGLEEVNVCGLSLGGMIAQELYLKKPSMVKSLILSNTISYTPFLFRNVIFYFCFKNIIEKTKEELENFFALQCIYNKGDLELLKSAEITFTINKISYLQSSLSSLSRNYLPILPFIKIPVLVLGSHNDKVTPVFSALQTYSLIPNSELHIFKECGHLSNIEKKDEFNDRVLKFLSKICLHEKTV